MHGKINYKVNENEMQMKKYWINYKKDLMKITNLYFGNGLILKSNTTQKKKLKKFNSL